jgi:hypothetical protein
MSKKKGINEYQAKKEARNGLVHRLSLLTQWEFFKCVVQINPVLDLAIEVSHA